MWFQISAASFRLGVVWGTWDSRSLQPPPAPLWSCMRRRQQSRRRYGTKERSATRKGRGAGTEGSSYHHASHSAHVLPQCATEAASGRAKHPDGACGAGWASSPWRNSQTTEQRQRQSGASAEAEPVLCRIPPPRPSGVVATSRSVLSRSTHEPRSLPTHTSVLRTHRIDNARPSASCGEMRCSNLACGRCERAAERNATAPGRQIPPPRALVVDDAGVLYTPRLPSRSAVHTCLCAFVAVLSSWACSGAG